MRMVRCASLPVGGCSGRGGGVSMYSSPSLLFTVGGTVLGEEGSGSNMSGLISSP